MIFSAPPAAGHAGGHPAARPRDIPASPTQYYPPEWPGRPGCFCLGFVRDCGHSTRDLQQIGKSTHDQQIFTEMKTRDLHIYQSRTRDLHIYQLRTRDLHIMARELIFFGNKMTRAHGHGTRDLQQN